MFRPRQITFLISGVLLFATGVMTLGLRLPNRTDHTNAETTASPSGLIADSFDIQVVGNKFHWDFRYPGPDGKLHTADDQTTDRILVLPPNKKVKFHITSDDYVYILGIPLNENGSNNVEKEKEIAVPEMTHYLNLRLTNSGIYDLMVDPLCGFQSLHDPLMGRIIVTDDHDFASILPLASQKTIDSVPTPL